MGVKALIDMREIILANIGEMTHAELAKKAGVCTVTIDKYVEGRYPFRPTLTNAENILDALGLKLEVVKK